MLTFLFRNLNGKPLQALVAELAREHQADVVMLAECGIPPDKLLAELNRGRPGGSRPPDPGSQCERIVIYPRLPGRCRRRVLESVTYFWHLIDQVLLRPSLLPPFRNEGLRIPDRAGTTSLLTDTGVPSR